MLVHYVLTSNSLKIYRTVFYSFKRVHVLHLENNWRSSKAHTSTRPFACLNTGRKNVDNIIYCFTCVSRVSALTAVNLWQMQRKFLQWRLNKINKWISKLIHVVSTLLYIPGEFMYVVLTVVNLGQICFKYMYSED